MIDALKGGKPTKIQIGKTRKNFIPIGSKDILVALFIFIKSGGLACSIGD